ncbi:trypsin-like peptidase domain-containing protein [Frigoriglobus tundricola]|uniref:HtrA protease/chaperone protein n=1 Tax=Frigoriglobus tundricola TaxID=2774151 RepID=A0A6M5YZS6_9BACT|nr:trypsin-like peptidase domain-containing protein [Frigoriglobus tundricola]QJW99378.1 HtrA protease/chaperone protein [Frigoriglobus tundricola]
MKLGRWPLVVACTSLGLFGGIVASQRLTGQPAVPQLNPVMPGRDWQSFAPVVKRVLPGVVCIEGQGRAKHTAGEDTDPGFGSGVIIDPSGVILTNNHVVSDLDVVEVTLTDGRKFTASDIRHDPKTDIALIKLEVKDALPVLEFGDSDAMEVGDRVLAVGAPFGLTGSVTSGIVSAKSRNNLKLNVFEDFIQTDAAMNPGNSGGALVNLEGKVIGLTAAIKTRTGGFQGVGLAVSSNLAKKVGDDLLKNGGVKRSYFGVAARDLDNDAVRKSGVRNGAGAVVTKVGEDSPAAKAGVQPGDVITKVNGKPVRDAYELMKTTGALPVGQMVDVLLWRSGKFYIGKVRVEETKSMGRPDAPAAAPEPPPAPLPSNTTTGAVGLSVSDLTADTIKQQKLPKEVKGVVIARVAPNSFAEKSGLASGTVVLKVDKTAVTSAQMFEQALRQAEAERGALLQVMKPNGDVDFVVLRLK